MRCLLTRSIFQEKDMFDAMIILAERTEKLFLKGQLVTFDSQLLYKMGRLIAFSLSMLGKCFRATISMFSSVQRLSSSSTSLLEEERCAYQRKQEPCGEDTSFRRSRGQLPGLELAFTRSFHFLSMEKSKNLNSRQTNQSKMLVLNIKPLKPMAPLH